MTERHRSRAILLITLFFTNLTLISSKPWIAKITPDTGSTHGATQIIIEGDSFSSNKFSSKLSEKGMRDTNLGNWVYIRIRDYSKTFTCDIEQTASNTEKLVCTTPNFSELYDIPLTAAVKTPIKWPFSNMHLFVVSDGEASNVKEFTASNDKTPLKYYLHDIHGYPDREILVAGKLFTRAYNESMRNFAEPSPTCQDKCRAVKFRNNDQICDIYQSTDKKVVRKYELDNNGVNKASGQFKCKLGGNIIGYQNITWEVTQSYGRSRSVDHRIVGLDGYIHDMSSFAKIDSLSNHFSGIEGGGILTIYGNYFLTNNSNKSNNTIVLVAGQKCQITSILMTEITCIVPPSNKIESTNEYYQGHRGINWHSYLGLPNADLKELESFHFRLGNLSSKWQMLPTCVCEILRCFFRTTIFALPAKKILKISKKFAPSVQKPSQFKRFLRLRHENLKCFFIFLHQNASFVQVCSIWTQLEKVA